MSGALAAAVAGDDQDQDYASAIKALDQANTRVNNNPAKHMAALAEAIAVVEGFPGQLANDPDGSRLFELANLNLARALLRAGDRAGATEIMDELLRRSGGDLPVQRFGPTLVEFHEGRIAELQRGGTAELQFKCEVSCQVRLDRHKVTSRSGPLYLGTYEVLIESPDGALPPERHTVELDEAGTVLMLRYPMAGIEPEPGPVGPPPPPKRLAPRWAEVVVAVVGLSAVAAGSALLAIDGRCPGGGDPVDDAGTLCPALYEASAGGAIALGLGAVAMTTGVVLLTLDEVQLKAGQRDHQAMVHWRVQF